GRRDGRLRRHARRPGGAGGASRGGHERKPQWVFLERIFPDIVLADTAALRATTGGTRVSGLRRAMFAAAALLLLAVGLALTVSWIGNRGLVGDTRLAAQSLSSSAQATSAAAAAGALPDADVMA